MFDFTEKKGDFNDILAHIPEPEKLGEVIFSLFIAIPIIKNINRTKKLLIDNELPREERIKGLQECKTFYKAIYKDLENYKASDKTSHEDYKTIDEISNTLFKINALIASLQKESKIEKNEKEIESLSHLIDNLKKSMDNRVHKRNDENKIKWLGKPAHLGYIFSELAKNGFIELPVTNGEISYSKLGRILFNVFDIDTTSGNLEKEVNENKNTLSNSNKAKFTIPELSQIK
ncbi:MAG: hypothetical protein K9G76_10375 [Bacteroidales bacterium]|nr:hypothetical protein [Bacteroidales bacterium]MCF8405242.1 hypothetical protein [Bacteroidales bacterium]